MFIDLALQLYIYVSFHYRFLTATFTNLVQGEAPWIYITLPTFLFIFTLINTSSPHHLQVFPYLCGYSTTPWRSLHNVLLNITVKNHTSILWYPSSTTLLGLPTPHLLVPALLPTLPMQ